MSTRIAKTLSDTAIYAIGVGLQNITSLVMLPIYTRYLAPADYGVVEILSMILDVTLMVFGLRADQGLFRYYHAETSLESRNTVVSTVLFLTLGLNAIGVAFLIAFSRPLAVAFLGNEALWNYLAVYSLCLLAPALVGVPYSYTRLIGRPKLFLALSMTKIATQVSLNILFVVVLELKALGVIYSTIITQLSLGSLFTLGTLGRVGYRFSLPIARRLISFSVPLVLSGLASFYVVFGDRYFLRKSWGLAAVGVYGLAYRFGFSFWGLTYEPFKRAWDGQKYDIYKQPDAVETYQRVFSLISKAQLLGALAVSLSIADVLRLFVGRNYWQASALIPILVACYVIRPLTDFCSFGLLLSERTRSMAHASWLSAAAMTVGYLWLIPPFGPMGAAMTAFAGFSIELYWVNRTAVQHYDMHLPWRRFAATALICVIAFLVSLAVDPGSMRSIFIRASIFIVAATIVYESSATTRDERVFVRRYALLGWNRLIRSQGSGA